MSEAGDQLWRKIRPDRDGLVPCVVQDVRSHALLMVAWVSKFALETSLERGYACYWSRSRGELWEKGATSGNRQKLIEVRLDCDGDTLMYLVEALGPACHKGHDTCFSHRREGLGWRFDPQRVLDGPKGRSELFADLEHMISALESAGDPKDRALFVGGIPTQSTALKFRLDCFNQRLSAGTAQEVADEAGELVYLIAVALRSRQLSLARAFDALLEAPTKASEPVKEGS